MIRLLHELHRSVLARAGHLPSEAVNHPRVELLGELRPELPAIPFRSALQDAVGVPAPEVHILQPKVDLYRLKDCWLAGYNAYLYPEPDQYFCPDNALDGLRTAKISRPIPSLARRIDRPVFHLAGNSVSRAHLVMEHLSRYQIAASRLPADTQVLIHRGQTRWQPPYLHAGGVRDLLESSFGTLFCKELYYVPIAGKSVFNLVGEPRHYLELRRNALAGLPLDRAPIFLSRKDAPDRRLLNEDRLFEIAASRIPGLRRITLSGMPFHEQLRAVAGAPVFISPHGQGTHLTLFCENTLSIQLVSGVADLANPFYECALLFDYFASIGGNQTLTCAAGSPTASHLDDWSYPEAHFDHVLTQALRAARPRIA